MVIMTSMMMSMMMTMVISMMTAVAYHHHGEHDDHDDGNLDDNGDALEVKDLWDVGDNLIANTDSTHRSNLCEPYNIRYSPSLTC